MALTDSQQNIVLNSISSVRNVEDIFIRNLEDSMRVLERNLTDLLRNAETLPAVDVALARGDIQRVLQQSGYFEVTGNLLNEGYQSAIEQGFEDYQDLYDESFQFAPASLQRLNALKTLDLSQFGGLSDDMVREMNRLMIDVNFGAITVPQAVQIMQAQVIQKLSNHAQTWVTTGLSGVYRESTILLGEDNGFTKFIYMGPLDAATRDFCATFVNQVKTVDEWNALQSEQAQISPVIQFGGGFNCRHRFVGVE